MKSTYLMYTLSAKSIIDYCCETKEPEKIRIDLRDTFAYNSVVLSLDAHGDCPYFHQLRLCKDADTQDAQSLKNILVFMDFSGIFGSESADTAWYQDIVEKKLFEIGLDIHFPDEESTVCFVPMDKSASMAKNCRICFMAEQYCEEMNRRLMLGMELENALLNKLYAYRGLYLSDANRVDDARLVLNEKTVLVIKDAYEGLTTSVITAKKETQAQQGKKQNSKWKLKEPTEETLNVNMFDGEGLISFDYAQIIQETLSINAYSFQVRAPFIKGMLHTIDFASILREALGVESLEGIQVKDAFGNLRNLGEVQIVLTKSQFKCFGWLETYTKQEKIADPMAYYFEKFNTLGHGLYIANTDAMLHNGQKKVALSYQFLNPMKLQVFGAKRLETLANKHVAFADKICRNKYYQKANVLSEQTNEVVDTDDRAAKKAETWLQVLQADSRVVHQRKIKGKLAGLYESRLRDTTLGRLAVDGEIRFLARDLVSLCFHLAKQQEDPDVDKLKTYFGDKILGGESFSLPGRKIKIAAKQKAVLLRNPHLSRNEEWLCSYAETKWRNENIGHLKGILEISYDSVANLALGGADFDGDLVKGIIDQVVVTAVEDGCYEKGKRTLPVIQIPSPPPPVEKPVNNYKIDYKTIKDTFSSRIGQISNATIEVGYWEYIKEREDAQNLCAKSTILTGLEIDSAKTGDKPYIEDITEYDPKEKRVFHYIKAKTAVEAMDPVKIKVKAKTEKTAEGNKVVGYTISTGRHNELKIPNMSDDRNQAFAPIDRLFWLYGEKKTQKKDDNKEEKAAARMPLLEQMPEGAEETRCKIEQIIKAYSYVLFRASADYRAKKLYETARYKANIDTILMLQYDSLEDKIGKKTVTELRNDILKCLCQTARTKYEEIAKEEKTAKLQAKLAEALLGWLITEDWQFVKKEERAEVLKKAKLGLENDQIALLTNFDCDGYRLLYYFLKDACAAAMAGELWEAEKEEEIPLPSNEDKNNPYTKAYLKIYVEGKKQKQTKAVWKETLVEQVRADVQAVEADMTKALRYVYEQRNKVDRNTDFFWEVFTAQEILNAITPPPQEPEKEEMTHA